MHTDFVHYCQRFVPSISNTDIILSHKHQRTANVLCYVLPPIKNCDLFVLNSYKDKSYIKMLGFSKKKNDWYHHYQQFLFKIYRKQWKLHGCTSFLGYPANGWAKSAQQLISMVLPFHTLYLAKSKGLIEVRAGPNSLSWIKFWLKARKQHV